MRWDTEVSQAVGHWAPVYGLTGSLTPALIHAVIERESAHGTAPNYVAHGGVVPEPDGSTSYGPMQINSRTIPDLHLGIAAEDLATHPELGIWYGVKEFARRMQVLGGDPVQAISAWNAGLGGVGTNPNYVAAVLAFWQQYRGSVASAVPALLAVAGLAWWLVNRSRRGPAARAA